MANWFLDDFTNNGSDENLDDHTPSDLGDGYQLEARSGVSNVIAIAAGDIAQPTTENNDHLDYSVLPSAAGADPDQLIKVDYNGAPTSGGRTAYIVWRATGAVLTDECWYVVIGPQSLSLKLYTITGGSRTQRTADSRELAASGALVEVDHIDNDVTVYFTGTGFGPPTREPVLVAININVHLGAGDILVGFGDPESAGRDISNQWDIDSIAIDGVGPSVGGPGAAIFPRTRPVVRL